MTQEEFEKNTVIAATTFNRKAITQLCFYNLHANKGACTLWIYDDHSTEYPLDFLQAVAPQATVKQPPKKLGIEKLRPLIHNEATAAGFKFIYHVDNDAYHDPNWRTELYKLYQKAPGLLGLYNSNLHQVYTLSDIGDYLVRKHCPGISFFYELAAINDTTKGSGLSWDMKFGSQFPSAHVTKTSFVEHLGAGGIHNTDFNRDRAINPTDWLKIERERIIKQLGGTP